ncbi:type-F conjugative transfer system pilin assembly protein TrbC [Sphingobium cupriresistens]|uniref:Conjugal transfer protein TrbC n=1 Tax=Sphingobium cupriresistens LL01 TaxID=1420583 RepID=A0A0J7Y4I4_9SPHN|nr:type-F conjugative transfer system pilin assembly protein TrbC [Sphingobium cupriresistens]KMS58328.1 hypothetical protein V473_09470 [Sphingobium cupriresistens LL01]
MSVTAAQEAPLDRLADAMEKRKPAKTVGPSYLPAPTPAMKRRAFEAMRRRVQAPALEVRANAAQAAAREGLAVSQEAMNARIYQALGLAAPGLQDEVAPIPTRQPKMGFVPLLFASSSMPVETLRTYAVQLERVGGVIAFRGMPGGMRQVAPMAELTAKMLRIDPGCEGPACAMRDVQVVVDPILFRQHGVGRVPAFAMVPGDPTQPYCEREDEAGPRASHLIYGDAALSGLVEEYARLGGKEEVSDAAARLSRR